MNIVLYERKHIRQFQPGLHDRSATTQLYCEQGWEGKAVSIQEDDRILGIVGIAQLQSTAHVWAVLSDEFRKRPVALCRMAKASLKNIRNLPGVECVEVTTRFEAAERWVRWLGFKQVGDGRYLWR